MVFWIALVLFAGGLVALQYEDIIRDITIWRGKRSLRKELKRGFPSKD